MTGFERAAFRVALAFYGEEEAFRIEGGRGGLWEICYAAAVTAQLYPPASERSSPNGSSEAGDGRLS